MTKRVVLLFAGQGSQTIGMGRDFYENFDTARARFQAADAQLGMRLSDIMFTGPESELMRTSVCQPALFLHGYVGLELLREKLPGLEIVAAAGLSLGEFTAHAAAGSFSFEAGLDLVAKRGRYMEEAATKADGIMAAMNGCTAEELSGVVSRFGIEIANYNAPSQFVISGPRENVLKAVATAENEGICKAQILNVSGAFHSRLMSPAQEKLAVDLDRLEVIAPRFPVISNVEARPAEKPDEIRCLLRRQITESVRWSNSLNWLVGQGETCFVQLGPGKSIAGLMRRNHREAIVYSIEDSESLRKAVCELQK